ncbi:DUF4920 domain-containing protein [Maribacter chungangensis]|uniref:DUF4920 domain-containing protein n=1 Tax=Maribacter chungangensis TaxID=1069117 RepID=A0ABW3B2U2_9FLAO
MKSFNILLVVFAMVLSCKGQNNTEDKVDATDNLRSFGDKIEAADANSVKSMLADYNNMDKNDTIRTKFVAKVKEVCKSKGCWMKLELAEGQEAMVRFKDYGFFMPMDIEGKEVIVNGLAFVESMSIEDQKHYAEDGGATANELAKITAPKKTYGFEANGVLLKD